MNQRSAFPHEDALRDPRCLSAASPAPHPLHDPDTAACGPRFNQRGLLILDQSFQRSDSRAFEGVTGRYLADAFSVWDSYAKEWLDNSPTLLRFETCDVVVSLGAQNSLAFWRGIVDTDARVEITDPLRNKELAERHCPTWRSNPALSAFVGSQALQIATASDERLVVDFTEGRLVIESAPYGIRH